jgi:DNA polymerase III subunit alpha, Gram-positive type
MNKEPENQKSTSTDIDEMCLKLLDTLKGMYWQLVPENFVIFDLETTGLTPRTDTILEIGAIAINKTRFLETGEVDVFECFIKQDKPIPPEAQRINHITDEMVKDGYSEYEALTKFFNFCNGKLMLSYNSPFDVKFLNWTSKRCKYPIEQEYLESVEDIYKLAKKYLSSEFVVDKRLSTIAEKIGVKTDAYHRALIDSASALYVYIFLKQVEFNEKHHSLIESSKRLSALLSLNEDEQLKGIFEQLYPSKKAL